MYTKLKKTYQYIIKKGQNIFGLFLYYKNVFYISHYFMLLDFLCELF